MTVCPGHSGIVGCVPERRPIDRGHPLGSIRVAGYAIYQQIVRLTRLVGVVRVQGQRGPLGETKPQPREVLGRPLGIETDPVLVVQVVEVGVDSGLHGDLPFRLATRLGLSTVGRNSAAA